MSDVSLDDVVSLCKRRGFIYQGSEIYGGLAGTWDYGPLGAALKRNLQNAWWKAMVEARDDIYGLDSAILMNPKVWEASGHVIGFTDPLVECNNCHSRFRTDHVEGDKCPTCGKTGTFGEPRQFNMMFKTPVGPTWGSYENTKNNRVTGTIEVKDGAGNVVEKFSIKDDRPDRNSVMVYDINSVSYLRPETAQGIFVNFKSVVDSFSPDLPFGIAQIGKAFRNEIAPRDFLFRQREFEQMEMQYFIHPDIQKEQYEHWRQFAWDLLTKNLGLSEKYLRWHEHGKDERAHYAATAHDIEFNFPFGFKELWGTHNRTDFDLKNHEKLSGKSMAYRPKDGGDPFVPYVIESSVGLDRMFLAVLTAAYTEDEVEGEKRIFLKLPAHLAPVKVAVFPLLKNKPELVKKAREVYKMLKKEIGAVEFDDNGNIGKRYRRQDEIGTPFCVTVDFDSLEDDTVTLRSRDTTQQERVKVEEITNKLQQL